MASSIHLANMISNGSFETNTTGWGGSHTLSRVALTPAHGESGSWAGQMSGSVNGAIYAQLSTALTVTSGRKYYIRAQVKNASSGYANIIQFMNNATALAGFNTQTLTLNQWSLYDGIWTANSAALLLRLNFTGGNGNQSRTAQFDNIMVIDLTGSYGASKEPGISHLRDVVNDYFDVLDYVDYEPIVITSSSLPNATKGQAYSYQVQATGDTGLTLSATGLPLGMSLSQTWLISGTPTEYGSFAVLINAVDDYSSASKQLQLTVEPDFVPINIITNSLPAGVNEQPYSCQLQATGNSGLMYLALGLPNGLSVSPDGLLSGTPTEDGTFVITINVVDDYTSASKNVLLFIDVAEIAETHNLLVGDMEIKNVMLGNIPVDEVYRGNVLIWERIEEPPDTAVYVLYNGDPVVYDGTNVVWEGIA